MKAQKSLLRRPYIMFKTLLIVTFKNMFFVMSVSGTVVFVLYMLLYPLSERYFSLKWRYRILKLAMMFFLVPFPLCKYYVWGFFYDHFSWIREIASQYESSEINTDYIIVANRDSILLSPKVQSVYLTVLVIVLISSVLLWKQITQYRKMKQICCVDLRESAQPKLQEFFSKRKAILNIRRNVKFIFSEYCDSPFTIGVLSPTILFPIWDKENQVDDELYEYMITHELVHIKHNDILIKLVGLLVLALHWFNPFVYLFIDELSCVSEMYCDSVVMKGKEEKERSRYGNLLLKLMAENTLLDKEQFGMGFANFRKKKMYKRRILELKRSKKSKPFFSAIIAAFICMAGGITVFAYQPPSTLTNESTETATTTDFFIRKRPISSEKLVSDNFAVSDDGIVYDLYHIDENGRAICNHDYSVHVEITEHKKNSNSGCTTDIYDGIKCIKCNDIKYGELLNMVTYMPCPH